MRLQLAEEGIESLVPIRAAFGPAPARPRHLPRLLQKIQVLVLHPETGVEPRKTEVGIEIIGRLIESDQLASKP